MQLLRTVFEVCLPLTENYDPAIIESAAPTEKVVQPLPEEPELSLLL